MIDVIKVSPEELMRLSGDLQSKISAAQTSYEQMKDLMIKTGGYWKGEGGDIYRGSFSTRDELAMEIFKRFQEHVTDLQTIAKNYMEAESAVVDMPAQLPADIIV